MTALSSVETPIISSLVGGFSSLSRVNSPIGSSYSLSNISSLSSITSFNAPSITLLSYISIPYEWSYERFQSHRNRNSPSAAEVNTDFVPVL